MPRYEYRCEANGRVVEVTHGMSERLSTWGEVRSAAGLEADGTPDAAPVERLVSLSFVSGGASPSGGGGHACGRPGCCGGRH